MTDSSKEMTFRDLISAVSGAVKHLVTKWRLLLLVGFIGGCIGGIYAKFIAVPQYTGELTFVLANESKAGGLGALAGSFGFDLGGGSEGAFSGENIIQLLQSRKMIERALFEPTTGTQKNLFNHIIEIKLLKKWKKKEYLASHLQFPLDPSKFNSVQDSLFMVVHRYVLTNYLRVVRPDKKLSLYKVTVSTPNEFVSQNLPKILVHQSAQFYIETKTKQASRNLQMLQREADSIRNVLGGNIGFVASRTDELYNLNPSLQRQRVSQQTTQVEVQVLGTAYGEVIKNLELAKITLQKETPLYQLLDSPSKKLVKEKPSALLFGIGIACLAFVLAASYLLMTLYFGRVSNN